MVELAKLPEHHLIERIPAAFLDEEDQRIASEIGQDYNKTEVSLITILTGAIPFSVNLKREIHKLGQKPSRIRSDAFRVESYGDKAESSGDPIISTPLMNPEENITGKDVILVEDIIDKGYTIFLRALPYILRYNPNSLVIASMLTKDVKRDPIALNLPLQYRGQDIDFFAVGRGLDWLEHYRDGNSVSEVVVHAK